MVFHRDQQLSRGFTLVELMVALAILSLIVVLAANMMGATQKIWKGTTARVEQFRAARQALDTVSARLVQATLNPYWVVASSNGVPYRYQRQSDLRFLAGPAGTIFSNASVQLPASGSPGPGSALFFQAPTGFSSQAGVRLDAALNTWGYYVEYGPDTSYRPPFLTSSVLPVRYRFRLIEFTDPSDQLSIFTCTAGNASYTGQKWFSVPLASGSNSRVLAENIVALVVLPKLSQIQEASGAYTDASLSPGYSYDSTGTGMATLSDPNLNPKCQLPPIVDVAVVAIDERSAMHLSWTSTPPDFGTGSLFQDPAIIEKDLDQLRSNLEAKGLSARVFRTSVPILAARWSTQQTN